MAGYNRLNDGYNERSGVNWGRVGMYAGGAALGYGVIRAGAIKYNKTELGSDTRALARWSRDQAKLGYGYGKKTALPWAKGQVKKYYNQAKSSLEASGGGNVWRGGLNEARNILGLPLGSSLGSASSRFQTLGRADFAGWGAEASEMRNSIQKKLLARGANPKKVGNAASRFLARKMDASSPLMQKMGNAGYGLLGWLGASDFAGAKNAGMKRLGVGAARFAAGGLALKAGLAAMSFINPFSD